MLNSNDRRYIYKLKNGRTNEKLISHAGGQAVTK